MPKQIRMIVIYTADVEKAPDLNEHFFGGYMSSQTKK